MALGQLFKPQDDNVNLFKELNKSNLITDIQSGGMSEEMEVGGRKGRFIFDKPEYLPQVGGGKVPVYKFMTPGGEIYLHRLEKNMQGGRWEDAPHAQEEFNQMKANPEVVTQMWGNSDVAKEILNSINSGGDFNTTRARLKQLNTHRQISGD